MSDEEFKDAVRALREIPYREDFQTALCELYVRSNQSQRDELRAGYKADRLGETMPWRNPTDYARSDLTREEGMRQSLIFLSIFDGQEDYREDLRSIAYCYHNLRVRGVDADLFLRQVAAMSGARFAELVLNFVNRPPGGKSLKAFGLEVVQTPDGPIAQGG